MTGLEQDTFDIGHAKYAAKYAKSLKAILLYIRANYKQGAAITEAMKTVEIIEKIYQSAKKNNHE